MGLIKLAGVGLTADELQNLAYYSPDEKTAYKIMKSVGRKDRAGIFSNEAAQVAKGAMDRSIFGNNMNGLLMNVAKSKSQIYNKTNKIKRALELMKRMKK
jgi:hypothetical protein